MSAPRIRYLPRVVPSWSSEADVLIVGTGAAGLSCALSATALGRKVTLLCKGPADGGSTPMALGGLAAVLGSEDTFAAHLADTLIAGSGLSDEREARELVGSAPGAIEKLVELGGSFNTTHLGLEGGHSQNRIVHAGGDASGAEVYRVLRAASAHANIETLECTVAVDLLTDEGGRVAGLLVGRMSPGGGLEIGVISTSCVVLAAGGLGQAYATSTNPAGATGDGLALALRAGAEVENVEFVQFHPTVMYLPERSGQTPLLTEALRGAGARIVDVHGNSVMAGRDPREDLAPRDVVSINMYERMQEGDGPTTNLWLDARPIGRALLGSEFPSATAMCKALGIDPAVTPIPIAPGAHYFCGGIRSNLRGTTSIPGLYAIGEVACTGVHGANRLASNSLTEAIVSGQRLGESLGAGGTLAPTGDWVPPGSGEGVSPAARRTMAAAMSDSAGVLRSESGLGGLLDTLAGVPDDIGALSLAGLEAANLHTASSLIAHAALLRQESRGCHRRSDFPGPMESWKHSIVLRVSEGGLCAVFSTSLT